MIKPAPAVVINVASAVSAGPTLISYVDALVELAVNPVPVPIVTVVFVAPAVPILNVNVPDPTV